ncbi:hypothetical protein QOZ80_2BG0188970 [Eleusine coracana subsp. coracana]|uniref:BHLH domain-containing protein n=1 Tax=Eleusine coracana subsp. coracana TaxID=191504 RepID=A0AAV9G2Z8_ELECO|nr:hypothetical protein QOZ80_UnG0725580 [Eleusine coracana subsp. coracana]KAK3154316.1 hypothetical protein QOZ80_2BG0188970 [Eleusine coracana subsp. coracana]
MAEDGNNQGAAAGNSTPPPASVTGTPSPRERTYQLDLNVSLFPAVGADVSNGKDVVVVPTAVHGGEGGSASGGRRTGADPSMDVVMDDDVSGKKAPPFMVERERRARMKKLYDELRSFLPNADKKTDQATIVNDAIGLIKQLEGTVQKLEKRKLERALARGDPGAGSSSAPPPPAAAQLSTLSRVVKIPESWAWLPKKNPEQPQPIGFQTWSERNVVLHVLGDQAFIIVSERRCPGVLPLVLNLLEKHYIDVITAEISGDADRRLFIFHTRVNVEEINKLLNGEAPASADIYKLAMNEIIVWLSGSSN